MSIKNKIAGVANFVSEHIRAQKRSVQCGCSALNG